MQGAFYTGNYRNVLLENGYYQKEIDEIGRASCRERV